MFADETFNCHHSRVPAYLYKEVKKPRAIQIIGQLLAWCNPQKPEVFVDQGYLASILGIHRDSVGRCIRYLEDINRLVFIGFCKDGRRKRYRMDLASKETTLAKENSDITPPITTSDNFAGRPQTKKSDDLRQNCRTNNIEERTELKEQQTVAVFSNKEFSSNEKIALKQKLKALGLFKQSSERLLAKYSTEDIERQIVHLQHLIDRGSPITNPASWLLKAVDGNYALPKAMDPNAQKEEQDEENLRKASIIAQSAKFELNEGKLEAAKDLAAKSLLLAKNALASSILQDAEQQIAKIQKLKEARAQISEEALAKIRQEEEQKELIKMRRWRKDDKEILGSTFFKNLVEAVIDQRLLGAG